MKKLNQLNQSLQGLEADTVAQVSDRIRGLEGAAGRIYFQAISSVLPPSYQFNGRSRQPAADAFNAFLNYAYGILYARVESALGRAGVNPYVGFLHRDGHQHKSMVFDFIEPFRIYAERATFQVFSGKKLRKGSLEKVKGGYYLSKEGKQLLIAYFNRLFDEKKQAHGEKRKTPANILREEAARFAVVLKSDEEE